MPRLRTLLITTWFPRTMPLFRPRVIRLVFGVSSHILGIIPHIFGVMIANVRADNPASDIIGHGLRNEARRRRLHTCADTHVVMSRPQIPELMFESAGDFADAVGQGVPYSVP